MNFDNINTIFFDYDGTLHNSLSIYKPAFLKSFQMLVDEGFMEKREWTDKEISKFLGQSPKEMWDSFGSNLPIEVRERASQLIGKTMGKLINEGKASLYNGAIDTLQYLKNKGYKLVFISNCSHSYMVNHTKMFHLDQYFDLMVNAEMYKYLPKEEILGIIKSQFPKKMVIIGDRHHDMKAGQENDIYTIACEYGFGSSEEHINADKTISDIKELIAIF